MNKKLISGMLATLALAALVAPGAIAADLNDVGFIDQAALGSLPQFAQANQQLAQYKASLDQQFAAAMRGAKTGADKQSIQIRFSQQLQDKQRELVGPLFQRAQLALATVAASKKLSIVVDKRIVVYGGQDVTQDVIGAVKSSQALQPPQASPPPSAIGFVDETALDGSSKVKDANDQLQKYMDQQRPSYEQKIKSAKTDVEKSQIASDFQKDVAKKRDELLNPLVEQTKKVTGQVAQSKNLVLVIDRADVIFGGMDITQDVQNALNK